MAEYKVTEGGNWQVCVDLPELVASRLKVGLPKVHHPERAALCVHPLVARLLPSAIDGVPIYGDGRHVDTVEEVTRRGLFLVEPGHWQDGGSQVWVDSSEGASGERAITVGIDDDDNCAGATMTVPRRVARDLGRHLLELAGDDDD